MTKVLTQRAVEAAKPPKTGRTIKTDGIVPGLRMIVHAGGKKSMRLVARINGKQENMEVGDLALMTLANARAKAKGMLAAIANGEDPRAAKRDALKAAAESVEIVARRFIERHAKAHNKSWKETERLIEREVLPRWGKRPITSITRPDVVALLDALVDRDAPVIANRVLAAIRKMFNWAIERGTLTASPCDRVKKPAPEVKRDRTHTDAELKLIWQATDSLGYPFQPLVQLLILTGQRREEIAGMRWSELDPTLTLWTLPRERAKNHVEHHVPIVPWARAILADLPRIEGSDLVFTTTGRTPVSGFSKAKRLLDAAITELNGGAIPPWVMHDFRRTMASGMARLGVALPVVEKLLNHVSGSFAGVAGIYQRHDFADEKRQALELWAQHLLTLDIGPAAPIAGEAA
jgi:integrase